MPSRVANVRLPELVFSALDFVAWAENRSRTDVMVEAIVTYLRQKQQDPALLERVQELLRERQDEFDRFRRPLEAPTSGRSHPTTRDRRSDGD